METANLKCVLAIDLGSSGPKVSIVNQQGVILATRSGSFENIYGANKGAVEQDAEEWWRQILTLSKEVIGESNSAKNIVAISNCAQYFTSIAVDENGKALHPAIMWEDARASKHIKKKMRGFPSVLGYNIFKLLKWLYSVGIPPILTGVDAGSHMLLLKNEMPEVWRKTYKVLEPSDFISLRCSGKFHTNENNGFAYTLIKKAAWSKGTFDKKLISFLGLDENKFPDILPVGANLGSPTEALINYLGISKDVAVFSGMQDTTAAILGGGAFENYDVVIEIGTTLNMGVVVPKRIIDILQGIYSVSSPVKDKFILVGEVGTGAKALNILMQNFLRLEDNLTKINEDTDLHYAQIADSMAAQSPTGCNGAVFMPWLFGSTFPEQDLYLRGGFLNISARTSRNDMIRAVFESYALNFKWMLQITQSKLKVNIQKVYFTGGGALWETAAQICADALQIEVHLIDEPRQANTKGIAAMCFHNLGITSYTEMKQHLKVKKIYYPEPQHAAYYDKQLLFFKKLYKTMRPLHKMLNG